MESTNLADVKQKDASKLIGNHAESGYEKEFALLTSLAHRVFLILGVIIIIAGVMLGFKDDFSMPIVWTCITAGILGSTSSALLSALQRKASGWETEDGKSHPPNSKKEKFSERMATFFLCRPIFGIIGGLLIYFGMQSGYLGNAGIDDPSKVIFWSLLSGLFVKSMLQKLKDLFDSLVGKE